jgi:hypothetical protein
MRPGPVDASAVGVYSYDLWNNRSKPPRQQAFSTSDVQDTPRL